MGPIKIGGGRDIGQEVTVHCGTAPKERRSQHLAGLKNLQWNGAKLLYSRNRKKPQEGRITMNIYVGNLSYEATDETIKQAFESFGEVTSARVIKDKYTGQSRGFGFVEMPGQSQAQTAIKSLNGKELLGKQISVNEARARADQGRTGGQGGRGRMDYSGRRNRY